MKARIRKSKRTKQRLLRSTSLQALLSAALAIPGLGFDTAAQAQSMPDAPAVRIRYNFYRDYQEGAERRMKIHAPMLSLVTPLGEQNILEANFVYDSMSGASPHYLSTLTGASEIGIHDNRRAGDLKVTRMFERFSVAVGGHVSGEDDYLSRGALLESKVWGPSKNSVLALGLAFDNDDIGSTLEPEFSDDRRTFHYLLGFTQVIDQVSIMQTNLTYSHSRGYQTDPYKAFDNRPRSRGMWAWLTRYNRFFPQWESSLHADYRLFTDTWSVLSHLFEVAWYQPLGRSWMIRPHVRYYAQSAADFFEGNFPPASPNQFFTADQRLGDFGSIGGGLKLIYDIGKGLSADAGIESFLQRSSFKLGGSNADSVEDFYATFVSVGITKKFE